MSILTSQKCLPCEGGVRPLTEPQLKPFLREIKGWMVIRVHEIEKEFQFPDFKKALQFVNKVGQVAEKEGHHPNIFLHDWNRVKITLCTHAIGGLSKNDFIVAAKIDALRKN